MSDAFISYARSDRAYAEAVAARLHAEGISVWWDSALVPGDPWSQKIREELRSARCVVVLWSHDSWKSPWVHAEALYGFQEKKIVMARLGNLTLEPPFNIIQASTIHDVEDTVGFTEIAKGIKAIYSRDAQLSKETAEILSRVIAPPTQPLRGRLSPSSKDMPSEPARTIEDILAEKARTPPASPNFKREDASPKYPHYVWAIGRPACGKSATLSHLLRFLYQSPNHAVALDEASYVNAMGQKANADALLESWARESE
jgi:hypothetical protein